MESYITTVDQDTMYQYIDGWDLLRSSLVERCQLLRGLEQLAKDHQGTEDSPRVVEFPLIRAQAILFELSMVGEYIDTLIGEINRYAQKCDKPRVEILKVHLNDLS